MSIHVIILIICKIPWSSKLSIIRHAKITEQIWERFYSTHCERINEGGGGTAQASRPLLVMESGSFIGVGQLFHGCDGKKNLEEISK